MIKLLTGIAAGILLGSLLAPEKGSVIRGKISDTGKNIGNRINELYCSLRDKLTGSKISIDEYAPASNGSF